MSTDDVMASFGLEPEPELVIPDAGVIEREGKRWAWCFDGPTRRFVEVEVRMHKTLERWVRRDTFDPDSIKECHDHYDRLQCAGKRVMDLGSNIGGFARMAVEQGATQVVAVEPCPYNFEILKLNSPDSVNIWAGAVPDDREEVHFIYAVSKRNSVSSSTLKRRNSSDVSIMVPARNIVELLDEYKPQVLKCDIEGGEYELLDAMGKIPDYVEQAAFEFHRGSEPYKQYPARFFPEDQWDMYEDEGGRFSTLRDLIFIRKGA